MPRSRWSVAAWVAVLVAVLGHLYVLRSALAAGTPSFNFDEIQSLMPGRALVGLPTPRVGGSGYFPLFAIVMAPVWRITSDPETFYRVALVVSLLLGLAAIWPLARVATRLGLTTAQAVTVAGVVMALPTHTVQAGFAIAEKPLMLMVALTALAVVRLCERPSYGRVVLVCFGVALCYLAHERMLTVVVAAFVWLALFTVRHVRIGLVGLAVLAVLSWLARTLALHLVLLVSPSGFQQNGFVSEALGSLRLSVLARTVTGQSWGQVLSTFGLAPLGLVVVVTLAVHEARRRTAGPAAFLVLAVGTLFAGSALSWARPDRLWPTTTRLRLDVWIYERYVDPLFTLVLLVALAAVVVGVRRRQVWVGAALSAGICLVTVLWLGPDAPTGGTVTPAHAPGAAAFWWARPDHLGAAWFWWIASVVALVPVVLLLVLRRAPLVLLSAMLALGAAGTASAAVASEDFHDLRAGNEPLIGTLRHVVAEHPHTSISYFWRCPSRADAQPGGRNRYAWMLLPTVLGYDPRADIVIACPEHPAARRPGSAPMRQVADRYYPAWVAPGPLQDALRTEGLLRPGY